MVYGFGLIKGNTQYQIFRSYSCHGLSGILYMPPFRSKNLPTLQADLSTHAGEIIKLKSDGIGATNGLCHLPFNVYFYL
jgi:hypothetical protein